MREFASNLGKGEVVSSILTGSTTKITPLFWSSKMSSPASARSRDGGCGARWGLCEPALPSSPEAAPHSMAYISGAMARSSQAPVLILTAPYASAVRIAMVVATAAA
jgi:hypothetical protein